MNLDDASTKLIDTCKPHVARTNRPWRVVITGLPGSGKSTLAKAIMTQAQRNGWPTLALSLDDFYLPRHARLQLARYIHPLLATRGVPGTHDLALLRHVLAKLPSASAGNIVTIPRFDKGRDTRRSPSRWPRIDTMPKLLIVEGWCLGIRAQTDQALARPCNVLERVQDIDGRWRQWVNRRLVDYLPLWHEADLRIHIRVPNWASVKRHRRLAEQTLRERGAPRAMDEEQLDRFLQHYERLGRHALSDPPARVDLTFSAHDLFAAKQP